MSLRLVATCAPGLEELLEGELRELGAREPGRRNGAVSFTGRWHDVWRASWRLRTANRVLVELASWPASCGEELSAGAQAVVSGHQAWDGVSTGELFDPSRTLALRATTARSPLRDTRWVALKVKDGLVDGQRRRFGRRASVDREHPDLQLRVRVFEGRATLLLDTSGESLDHRGYRVATGAAPVREQVAAGCVLAAGWDGRGPVVDPMCGSGTLLAEAGAWALGLAPGRMRERWGFESLPGFDPRRWQAIRREPTPPPGPDVHLFGVDRSSRQIQAAAANLRHAGLSSRSTLSLGDAFAFEPPATPGLLLLNPPYGERMEEAESQWPRLGDLFKQRYQGWRVAVLAGGPGLGKQIGLRPSRRIPVRNGPLEARILVFEIY